MSNICEQRYYEADMGYMCWINKKPCNKNNCTLKHRFAKEFSKKVIENITSNKILRSVEDEKYCTIQRW